MWASPLPEKIWVEAHAVWSVVRPDPLEEALSRSVYGLLDFIKSVY